MKKKGDDEFSLLSDVDKEAYAFNFLRSFNTAVYEEDVALGLRRASDSSKNKRVSLQMKLLFRPDICGTYNRRKISAIEDSMVYFAFEPDRQSDEQFTDAWEMRVHFLRPEDTFGYAGLDGITWTFGRFGDGVDDISVPHDRLPKPCTVFDSMALLQSEFSEWQSLIRSAMKTKMSAWPTLKTSYPVRKVNLLCQPMRLAIEWQREKPVGIVLCTSVLQALVATLQIDALLDTEYRFCACVGCHKSFKVKRKDQRYCGERCKHRQVVRDGRAKQALLLTDSKVRNEETKQK